MTHRIVDDRAFRWLWGGSTISQLGTSVTAVAAPLLAVQTLKAGALTVSLLTAAVWAPWLLIGLPAGAWIDRVTKRPVMLACDAASAALAISIPVAAWAGCLTVAHLLTVAVLLGTSAVFFQVAWTSYLPAMFHERDLIAANATLQGSQSATQIAGPTLAGTLAATVGAAAGLALDAASFVLSAFCLLTVRRPERRPAPTTRRNMRHEIGQGIRAVATDPYLRYLSLSGAAANLAGTGYQSLLVVFLIRDIGVGSATVGLLLAVTSLGGLAGAATAPWLARRIGTARTLLLCRIGVGPFALLIPLTRPGVGLAFFIIGNTLVVVGAVAGNTVAGSFRQIYCPPGMLGRVLASMQFINFGAIPIGAVVGGTLATTIGMRTSLWIMTTGLALSGLILLLSPIRGRRDMPTRVALPVQTRMGR